MNKTDFNEEQAPFGHYAPDRSTAWLCGITKLGISRGIINRWVCRRWFKKEHAIVDATVRDINFRLHIRKNTTDAKLLSSSKVYDRVEVNALAAPLKRTPSDHAVFVDVGANTGYYALSLAHRGYGKVIAIEPNPITLKLLRCNIGLNPCGRRVTVVPLCIGDGQKTPFYCSGGLGDASVIATCHNCEPTMVDSAPLLDIIYDNGVSRIDGMKIDIEGYEDRALEPFFASAPATLHPAVIVIEVCNRNLWQKDIIAMLNDFDYRVQKKTRANYILKKA